MMIIATGPAVLTFILVEIFYLNTIYNLEAGFLPALILAVLAFIATNIWLANIDTRRDFPEATQWQMPAPQAIAVVKRILKTYSSGRSRWFIHYEDRQAGEIHATFSFIDDSYGDMRWLVPAGRIEKNIHAHILFIPKLDSTTEVVVTWIVDAPISRFDCNSIIADTTNLINQNLADAQHSRLISATN